MKQSLEVRLGQSLKMTPQLQQSIRLLQLSLPDLLHEIQEAITENPLLEDSLVDVGTEQKNDPADESESASNDDLGKDNELDLDSMSAATEPSDGDNDWQEEFDTPITNFSAPSDGAEMDFDARVSVPESLTDHLLWQARMTRLSKRDALIVEAVIQSIDDTGYLRATRSEIATILSKSGLSKSGLSELDELELDEIGFAIKMVQSFDPVGVAAKSLGDRLRLLIEGAVELGAGRDNALSIVANHLEALGARDFVAIKRGLGLSQGELDEALTVLGQIDPRIDYSMGNSAARYVSPDLIAKKTRGVWRVELNPAVSRKLYINPEYERLSEKPRDSEEGKYLGEKLQSARWFIKGLQGRYETLLRVARSIVVRQEEFLDYGELGMKPMVLNDVAQELGMHESTISRATSNKYMLTPAGVFELKYFFTSSVSGIDGDPTSSTAVRSLIKKLIEGEPVNKPISDNGIANMLNQKGYSVARRTIAKYRESMNIPSSSKRKGLII
ncbi:MAG: RNA polymerase factor sigma-54 [Proteobacteria bacterium]|nr:RNA polymerase factor sigma-54 [Pseudomonadota bacterium]